MQTIDTIMSNIVNLRVHIAPVGFEIDRIAIPATQMKADRVWLLMHADPAKDKALGYMEKIRALLKKEKIDVNLAYTDRFDLFKILRAVREIVEKEKEENFQQARFASLDKNIIQPLLNEWKFVEVERVGRTRWIKMTQEGVGAVEFLS